MTIGELKRRLDCGNKPIEMSDEQWDNILVMIPTPDSDGIEFITPDELETGIDELQMVDNPDELELAFLIVPDGYMDEGFDPQLN